MNKCLTILGTLIISSTTLAGHLECRLNILNASTSGLMPAETTLLLNQTQIQTSGTLDLQKCTKTEVSNLNIALCGHEDIAAAGVFHAELLIEEKNTTEKNGLEFTSASELLAIAKKGETLVSLQSKSGLTPTFVKKMTAANLSYPDYEGGDSLQIDDAVTAAVKKGILTEKDIVAVSIDECRLK